MQRLKIDKFLGIQDVDLEVSGVTIVIGEQATGKSIIARLIYFFNEYFAGFDEISLSKSEHKSSYDKRKKAEFSSIFPPYSWEAAQFSITYENESHWVELTSAANSSAINLKTSPSVAAYFRDLKKEYSRFAEDTHGQALAPSRLLREFRNHQIEKGAKRYESALFVPAARSFYATIRDEIFSLLALDNKIDQIILQFGEFYETAKFRNEFERSRRKRNTSIIEADNYFSHIVKGKLFKEDGRDWLQMDRGGKIEMSRASSGQQEATPLLMAIAQFPSPGRTLIIEEPEAHLFPTAQVKVLEFILKQARETGATILFTTHSPYMLSAMNVYLTRDEAGLEDGFPVSKVHAFSISDGTAESIVDRESGLISADYIDSVSEVISEEYDKAMEALLEGL
ncbi:ATP-binding protein [Ferrimonas balearica]|nr:ATP-binding protein [Ferrimonas balearica]